MDKVRLDYFLSVGGLLVDNDEYKGIKGRRITLRGVRYGNLVNEPEKDDDKRLITSFTERENKGVQPVPDGFPVVVMHRDSHFPERCLADDVNWNFSFTWKPDYDKLLEMQKEHDKEQLKKDFKNGVQGKILTPNCMCSMKIPNDIEELMINAKESKMSKNNKHPHHDLIVEWLKDTSKVVQGRVLGGDGWDRVDIVQVIHCDEAGYSEFRFKPREFQKGHWYPVRFKFGDNDFMEWTGNGFEPCYEDRLCAEVCFEWIGESLGDIKFGGEE